MNLTSILRKAFKDGYYVVACDAIEHVNTETEALRLVSAWDKVGRDSAVYSYRDGVFHRCTVVELHDLFTEQQNS